MIQLPRPQLHSLIAGIGDDDGVGPEVTDFSGDERSGMKFGSTVTSILAGHGAVHAAIITKSSAGTNLRSHRGFNIVRNYSRAVWLLTLRDLPASRRPDTLFPPASAVTAGPIRCQMTSIADQVAAPPDCRSSGRGCERAGRRAGRPASAISLPAVGERELPA